MTVKQFRKNLRLLTKAERLYGNQIQHSQQRAVALEIRGQHLTSKIAYYQAYRFESAPLCRAAGFSSYAQSRLVESLQSTLRERSQLDEALRKLHKQKHILSSRRLDFARKLRKAEERSADRL